LSSVAGHAGDLLGLLARQAGFFEGTGGQEWLSQLAFLAGSERDARASRDLLVQIDAAALGSGALMRAATALARGRQRVGGSFRDLGDGKTAKFIGSLVAAAARVAGADGPVEDRAAAIGLLALADEPTARGALPALLDARQPVGVQLAVLQALTRLLDRDTARAILGRWRTMSPAVRREAVEAVFSHVEGIEAVVQALETRALAPWELDPARLRQLQARAGPALEARVRKILAAQAAGSRDRSKVVASYRPAIDLTGDRDKGRNVFSRTCAGCHQAEGRGVDVGPNLATVAGRSPEDLLTHILDPNREVAANFVNYQVALRDGRVVSGIIAEELAHALTLKRELAATDVVARDQIETMASTGASIMPDGLEKGLSHQDLADLIAFVRSIRGSAGALPAAPASAQ
jgi:putative heme-binding domain-containing protein